MWIINTWPLCVCICVCVCVPDKHPADPHVIYADVRTHTAGTDEPVWMKHDFFLLNNKCAAQLLTQLSPSLFMLFTELQCSGLHVPTRVHCQAFLPLHVFGLSDEFYEGVVTLPTLYHSGVWNDKHAQIAVPAETFCFQPTWKQS